MKNLWIKKKTLSLCIGLFSLTFGYTQAEDTVLLSCKKNLHSQKIKCEDELYVRAEEVYLLLETLGKRFTDDSTGPIYMRNNNSKQRRVELPVKVRKDKDYFNPKK